MTHVQLPLGGKLIKQAPVAREHWEQVALVRWLDARKVIFCHVPNGGKRSLGYAQKLKAAGVRPGVPDILIFSPAPSAPNARGVAIELKAPKEKGRPAGRISQEQTTWLLALGRSGWLCKIAYGFNDAVRFLTDLGF